jgi:hypothetical protein
MSRYVLCVLLFASTSLSARAATPDETLAAIRAKAQANEKAASVIKFSFESKNTFSGYDDEKAKTAAPRQVYFGTRTGGRTFSRSTGTWAQVGDRHYAETEFYYKDEKKPAPSGRIHALVDGVTRAVNKEESSKAFRVEKERIWTLTPSQRGLGLRPFQGKLPLSEVLVPEMAEVREESAKIGGRDTYVLDFKSPHAARMWIDKDRGVPLQIHYFLKPVNDPNARCFEKIEKVELLQLPTGGWFPVASLHTFSPSNGPLHTSLLTVDQKSITTKREDIPDKLFVLELKGGDGL